MAEHRYAHGFGRLSVARARRLDEIARRFGATFHNERSGAEARWTFHFTSAEPLTRAARAALLAAVTGLDQEERR